MPEHISALRLERFCARTLPGRELTAIAEHLSTCHTCQRLFSEALRRRRDAAPVSFTLAPEWWLRNEHLASGQLAAYVEGGSDEAEREIVELHLASCVRCREDVRSFRGYRQRIAPEMTASYGPRDRTARLESLLSSRKWLPTVWKPAYAVAVAVLFAGAILIATLAPRLRHNRLAQEIPTDPERVGARVSPESKGPVQPPESLNANDALAVHARRGSTGRAGGVEAAARQDRAVSVSRTGNRASGKLADSSVVASAALKDGQGMIAVDSSGAVVGLENITPETQFLVKEILLTQKIERPAVLGEIAGEYSSLRGAGERQQSFRLLSPATAVITEDRPTFRWAALPGATGYRVQVADSKNREAASSGELPATALEWTPPNSLRRGEVYTWAVVATVGGEDVVSPDPSAPEVRFRILPAERLRELNSLRDGARSHLALGVFYAREGMIDEAEREFQALVRLNPRSQVARKLLDAVRSWR